MVLEGPGSSWTTTVTEANKDHAWDDGSCGLVRSRAEDDDTVNLKESELVCGRRAVGTALEMTVREARIPPWLALLGRSAVEREACGSGVAEALEGPRSSWRIVVAGAESDLRS